MKNWNLCDFFGCICGGNVNDMWVYVATQQYNQQVKVEHERKRETFSSCVIKTTTTTNIYNSNDDNKAK